MESVYHILEYEYTEANVSLTALKNRDSAQVRVLKDLSQQLPFQLFVALLEKQDYGSCMDDFMNRNIMRMMMMMMMMVILIELMSICDQGSRRAFFTKSTIPRPTARPILLKDLFYLEGKVVGKDLLLDRDSILDESGFDSVMVEEEVDGYMGNEGVGATHWYRVTNSTPWDRDELRIKVGR
ncbi:hypothetical protein QC761_0046390 [Podospora bellae-mahoneyi]|uniref:Uncharacterized protein n=1 Tax=Podospora bellae-mahoneyi TaxID=2093777 RepID=A0ABR0FV22_9PEZI|nr:hypothetical protein QC761_0046390 [Podospora bellae-mahoneyi]